MIKIVFAQLIEISISSLGIIGGLLVLYGYLSAKNEDFRMKWVDDHGEKISNWLTVIGTIITVATIYIKGASKTGEVWPLSIFVTGPIILVITGRIMWDLYKKKEIPKFVIIGLALVAIAGTLIRLYKTSVLFQWLMT